MPGMPTSLHQGGSALHLLPTWLGAAWAAVFVVVAASHVRHMLDTTGQRRPWHACHVLMAIGMAVMFAPASIDPLALPSGFWRLTFAAAGVIAAVWAIGGVGRTATTIWLLTSIDLGVMLYMWAATGHPGDGAVTWLLCVYLVAEALAWGLDLYRRLDGATPLVSWQLLAVDGGVSVPGDGAGSLLGTLDISASMIAMTIGMAYMLAAMQLAA